MRNLNYGPRMSSEYHDYLKGTDYKINKIVSYCSTHGMPFFDALRKSNKLVNKHGEAYGRQRGMFMHTGEFLLMLT